MEHQIDAIDMIIENMFWILGIVAFNGARHRLAVAALSFSISSTNLLFITRSFINNLRSSNRWYYDRSGVKSGIAIVPGGLLCKRGGRGGRFVRWFVGRSVGWMISWLIGRFLCRFVN